MEGGNAFFPSQAFTNGTPPPPPIPEKGRRHRPHAPTSPVACATYVPSTLLKLIGANRLLLLLKAAADSLNIGGLAIVDFNVNNADMLTAFCIKKAGGNMNWHYFGTVSEGSKCTFE